MTDEVNWGLKQMLEQTLQVYALAVRISGRNIDIEWFLAGPGKRVRDEFGSR